MGGGRGEVATVRGRLAVTRAVTPPPPRSRSRMASPDIRLQGPIPEDRFDDVIAHLRCSFFADEPLNRSVHLCERGQPHRELEEHARQTLRDNLSEMALDATTNQVRNSR